jgi:P4 family phage/plasmid primase-like protien
VVNSKPLLAIKEIMVEFAAIQEDILLLALQRQGLTKGKAHGKNGRKGAWNLHCPWKHKHTPGMENDSECTYWPRQDDDTPPGFKCLHASCDKRDIKALIRWMRTKDPEFNEDFAELAKEKREQARKAGKAGVEAWEIMLAQNTLAQHGTNFVHIKEQQQWLHFGGARWIVEKTDLMLHLVKQTAIALGPPGKGIIKVSNLTAAERIARTEREIAKTADQFDQKLELFNHQAGTFDTVSLTDREHRREDYITKCAAAAYRPGAPCPLFEAFLDRIFAGDADMIAYVWRTLGYCLTGETDEHVFFNLWGKGRNGKTVLVETIAEVMGDYAQSAPPSLFVMTHNEQHPTALADLAGKRFVYTSELSAGQAWNVETIKRLTGGDSMKARKMRENFWEFKPQCKLFIAGNHKLTIRRLDDAIKERLHLWPFTVRIPRPERDRGLKRKLLEERDGILARAAEGLRDWRRSDNGLDPPRVVLEATAAYFEEEDTLGNWLSECCEVDPEGRKKLQEKFADLYQSYVAWLTAAGVQSIPTKIAFGRQLDEKGFPDSGGAHNVAIRVRLRLRDDAGAKKPDGSTGNYNDMDFP